MFNLARYLPYLVNRTGARLAEAFTGELAAYGITLPMWRALAALHHRDGQRVGQLAEMTSIEVSTLSRLLGVMERKGLVRRHRAEADARTVTVRLTEAGARLTLRIIDTAVHYEAVALKGLSDEEGAALKAMLVRVFENLDELDREAASHERRA